MKKHLNKGAINLFIIIIFVVLAGGIIAQQYFGTPKGEKEDRISEVKIPQECQQFKDDTCGLFDCMVSQCWCDGGVFPSPILAEVNIEILNEQEAIAVVKQYLENNDLGYNDVRKAIRLNSVFFNVFAYNAENDEKAFTVRTDGTIITTICGV